MIESSLLNEFIKNYNPKQLAYKFGSKLNRRFAHEPNIITPYFAAEGWRRYDIKHQDGLKISRPLNYLELLQTQLDRGIEF